MTWWAIDVRTAPEHRAAVGAWLVARTGHAIEERDDGLLVGFAADETDADRLVSELAGGAAPPAIAERRALEPVDWSVRWREGLGPRRFGRLTIAPSWSSVPAGVGPLVVLDPENAFGSGEHGSTRTALALLERHLRPRERVLDLGSGSGILAIAAVKLGAVRATGIESDAEANAVAERNAVRNGVADQTAFLEGDAAALAPLVAPAELVCSNILRSVNTALLPVIFRALAPGGRAIFAGMESSESVEFESALDAAGFALVDAANDAGWWGVAARVR
ncbi:MAG: 50S ribosomal protein L11 methyltransferase [Gemmatimonadales bacterium]